MPALYFVIMYCCKLSVMGDKLPREYTAALPLHLISADFLKPEYAAYSGFGNHSWVCPSRHDSNTRRISSVQDPEKDSFTLSQQSRQQHWQNILKAIHPKRTDGAVTSVMAATPVESNQCYPQARLLQLVCTSRHDSNTRRISSVQDPKKDPCTLSQQSRQQH